MRMAEAFKLTLPGVEMLHEQGIGTLIDRLKVPAGLHGAVRTRAAPASLHGVGLDVHRVAVLEARQATGASRARASRRARGLGSRFVKRPSLRRGERVWLPGHSPVSGGIGQLDRQLEVRSAVPSPPSAIALHFHVPSYTRRGHYFDMESLGYVILASWRHDLARPGPIKLQHPYRPTSVWITMALSSEADQGLHIANELPPTADPSSLVAELTVADPPTRSIRGTVLSELTDLSELAAIEWLGLELSFGAGVDIREFGFAGPIKPLIDATRRSLGGIAAEGQLTIDCTISGFAPIGRAAAL